MPPAPQLRPTRAARFRTRVLARPLPSSRPRDIPAWAWARPQPPHPLQLQPFPSRVHKQLFFFQKIFFGISGAAPMPPCPVLVVPARLPPAAAGAVVHLGAHPAPKGARPGKAVAFLRLPAPSRLGPLCTIYLYEETGPFMYFSAYLYLSLSVFSVCAGRGGSVRRGD